MRITAKPGPSDSLTDVGAIKVGQVHDAEGNTGVTVIVPDAPAAMGVDVRGGGPGTRETDALNPTCLVEKAHAIVLSGGSVFGLAAADGVAAALSARGIGLPVGPMPVPVVPGAILFDLKNGGNKDWGMEPPYRALGIKAVEALSREMVQGRVGAGYGARAGGVQGGVGSASYQLEDGSIVAALVVVNSFGSADGAAGFTPGTLDMPKVGFVGTNTTLAVIATNVALGKAACERLATMAHDGLARAIKPLHTPFDGDTVFALSTGEREPTDELPRCLTVLGGFAADALERAVAKAISAAQ
ncbi:P1 family peptidase [Kordiimonas gwangyangensis]|uniref:P1 family peptidase n=1 Tax=Kordiimonas gwangyangensis TaxID=288022 RepID=UPI0003677F29|nr:P1 family peptidase [Kordiimonas gwangyangensis]